jgi:hypothetical protein
MDHRHGPFLFSRPDPGPTLLSFDRKSPSVRMLSKKILEKLMEIDQEQLNAFSQKVASTIGSELKTLLPQQKKILNNVLNRIFLENNQQADQISPEEIEGALELVTEHLYPYGLGTLLNK